MNWDWQSENETIVSVTLVDGGLEVVKRRPSNAAYCTGQPVPDLVCKEIYVGGPNGNVVLGARIHGKHTPAYRVPESITFGDEE
jgi:hypothetical protein